MAQFVCQNQNFRHGVRDESPEHLGHDGKMVPHVRPLEAVFDRGGLTPEAITEAKAKLTFHGLMEHESGEDLDPVYRMSVFDSEVAPCRTDGRTHEERARRERAPRLGRERPRVRRDRPAPRHELPWANYDEIEDPKKVSRSRTTIGADLDEIIRYELENQKRERWLEALGQAKATQEEVVIVKA